MLILIGLLIVYIDIFVGSVDVVPDLIGYLLMIPGFLIERGKGWLSLRFALVLLVQLLVQAAGFLPDLTLIPMLILYLLDALLVLILGRMFLTAVCPDVPTEDADLKIKTLRTAMFFIFAATLAILPLETFSAAAGHILRATTALCGLFIVFHLYQFHRDKE
ncbi:MAG: hypothetical protein K6A77_00555 [Clostridiales bacterium]|nr:hypothetical protein [Clostridiales bacterium]